MAVQHWPSTERLHAYALSFVAAGIVGFISVYLPVHRSGAGDGAHRTAHAARRARAGTARRREFRRVVVFMAWWNFASNLAAPFLTVYLLQQMGYGIGTVNDALDREPEANALTMYLWGRLSDRLSNKAILAVAAAGPYFGCSRALPFAALPHSTRLRCHCSISSMPSWGAASGGIALATATWD